MDPTETFREYVQRRCRGPRLWRMAQGWWQQGSTLVAGLAITAVGAVTWSVEDDRGRLGIPSGLLLSGLLALGWSVWAGSAVALAPWLGSPRRDGSGQVWQVDLQQLWQDYLQDLRLMWLDPQYGRLEGARQMLTRCLELCDELWLELVEADYWLSVLPGNPPPQDWLRYVGQIQQHHCRLLSLVPQLQSSIERFEAVLGAIEQELEDYFEAPQLVALQVWDGGQNQSWEHLRELDLVPVMALSQDLHQVDGSLRGVTQEVEQVFRRVGSSSGESRTQVKLRE